MGEKRCPKSRVLHSSSQVMALHGPKMGSSMACAFLVLKALLTSGLDALRGTWPDAMVWGSLGMPKCITGTPKGPQSLASLSDRMLLEHLKALCSAKSVKIRQ